MKHCTTRWLSLLRCVGRYIAQFDGLLSFFRSCDEAETRKVVSIIERLANPLTKPLLLFLSFILPSMDRFNKLFQKSTENTTCKLYSEMSRLVRLYASNLLKAETILAAGDDFTKLNFSVEGQLADENLGLGNDLWVHLSSMEEYDPSPFYRAVRGFYVASVQKMLKKFPFGDSILKDLDVINPDKFCTCSFSTVESCEAISSTRFG